MELVLSRDLANLRIWPAMNLAQSGTRKEELLLGPEACGKLARLRRRLMNMQPTRQMETLLDELSKQTSNSEFLANLAL
jgi:transcription termination factor Rho